LSDDSMARSGKYTGEYQQSVRRGEKSDEVL
jgi:hypothetical protein